MLLFMYCVRLLEKELCYPVLTKVEKRERKMYALFSKSEAETNGDFQIMSSPDVPLIYTLPGRASCSRIFSAVECVLLIFQ